MEKRGKSVLKNFFVGSNDSVSQVAHNWGIISGVVISLGFGLLRVARAADVGEILFASALTIVEVGAIGFLEWKARSLRAAGREWNLKRAREVSAQSRVQSASANVTRLQERLKALDDDINRYTAHGHKLSFSKSGERFGILLRIHALACGSLKAGL